MTTHPQEAAFGAYLLVASDPIAKRAMSHPIKSNVSRSFVTIVFSPKLTSVPRERRLASAATSSAGNSRSARILSISRPTFPVAPATITL